MAKERVLDEVVADFRDLSLDPCAMPYHHIVVMLTLMHAAGWGDMDYETLADRAALFAGAARERGQEAAARYLDAHASWVVFDELLGQRFVHQHGGNQNEGWAAPDRRTKGSAAIYAALEHEKAALALLRQALAEDASIVASE